MVVDTFLELFFGALETIVNALPDYTHAPSDGGSALTTIVAGAQAFGNWVNLTAFFAVFALWVALELATTVAKVAVWVWERIPFN